MKFERREQTAGTCQPFGPDVLLNLVGKLVDQYRHPGDFMTSFSEMDSHPPGCWLAPAASRAKATQTAYRLADHNTWSERVSRAPPRESVISHDDHRGDYRRDETTVINSSRAEEIER